MKKKKKNQCLPVYLIQETFTSSWSDCLLLAHFKASFYIGLNFETYIKIERLQFSRN